MIIRQATKQDVNSMADLLAELFLIESDFIVDRDKQISGLNMLLEDNSKGIIFVGEENNQVIAMCSLQYLISTAQGGMVGLIEDMVVCAKQRNKGRGRQLLRMVSNYAQIKGISRLQLLADKDNQAALNFYKNIGFKSTKLIALRTMLK